MAENPECWLHVLAGTKLGPKDHSPVECRGGGGGGHGERDIFDS